MRKKWTTTDNARFAELWATKMTCEEIGAVFGVRADNVRLHRKVLGLPRRVNTQRGYWSTEHDAELSSLWGGTLTLDAIAEKMGRTPFAVQKRAAYLKLAHRPRRTGPRKVRVRSNKWWEPNHRNYFDSHAILHRAAERRAA